MSSFWLDLGLGIGIAAGSVVVLEGVFRVGEVAQRVSYRRRLNRWRRQELEAAKDRPHLSVTWDEKTQSYRGVLPPLKGSGTDASDRTARGG